MQGNQTPFIVYAQLLNGNSIYTSLGNALNQVSILLLELSHKILIIVVIDVVRK